MIRPTFDYALLPSIRSRECHLNNIKKFQNKVLRYINGTTLIDHVPNAVLHEKFKVEDVRGRLMYLAKRQVNKIVSDNLQHTHDLQIHIASLSHGQILWQHILN